MNSSPVAYTDELVLNDRVRKYDDKPVERPLSDAITETLGATFYINDKRFNQLRKTYQNRQGQPDLEREGEKFVFTRWYPEVNVIVDMLPVDNDKVRQEIAEKRSTIVAYNRQSEKKQKLGYLPVFIFQRVHKDAFEAAKAKKVLELPDRPAYFDRLMREKGYAVIHA